MAKMGIIYVTDDAATAEEYRIRLFINNMATADPKIPSAARASKCIGHPGLANTGAKSVVKRYINATGPINRKENDVT